MFYHKCLKSQIGNAAYQYFKSRELSDKVIVSYGLGYAPDGFALINYMKTKGYKPEQLYTAGLAGKSKNGNYYDYFRNRVMFPIIDVRGKVIAFGGRVLDDSKPKYLNSPDTPVFKKSKNLFSLNFARKAGGDTLILAEGYMDVIAIYKAGFENVVATLGTALTPEQARIMAKTAKTVIIAYDSDQAGQNAVHKALDLFSQLGVNTKILKMAPAKDPDEYIKRFGIQRFEMLIKNSDDVIEYELEKLEQQNDLSSSQGKMDYIRGAVKLLSDISSEISRDIYASSVSEKTNVSKESILNQIRTVYKSEKIKQSKKQWAKLIDDAAKNISVFNPQKRDYPAQAKAEEGIIAYLIKYSAQAKQLVDSISEDDFATDFNKEIFVKVKQKIQNDGYAVISDFVNELSDKHIAALSQMVAQASEVEGFEKTIGDNIKCLKDFKTARGHMFETGKSNDELREIREYLLKKKMGGIK